MCGRYAITLPPEAVRGYFRYIDQPNFPPRLDVRPTQPVPIVRMGEGGRRFDLVRWGFLPAFVRDEKSFPLLINARAETAFEKPSFRNAIRRRRCLFIADAFYEWHKLDEKGRKKQPYCIRRPMQGPLALAGIWEGWQSPEGSEIDTAAILTTSANATLAPIHDRMPVILEPAAFDDWLARDTSPERVASLLRPLDDDQLERIAIEKVGTDLPGIF